MNQENSMQKVADRTTRELLNDVYKPSAPENYTPPTPVRVPVPLRAGKQKRRPAR